MNMSSAHRQEFCVRWNSHLGSIGAAFPQLLAGQRFVDVTLACEGHQVHCHRLVLAACSSYFESILSENPCKHPQLLRCAEQLRIRGLYGSDAALNLNQLKALSQKVLVPTNHHINVGGGAAGIASNHNIAGLPGMQTDCVDEEDTATSSTITSQINQHHHQQQQRLHQQLQQQQQQQHQVILPALNAGNIISEQFIKREPITLNSNPLNMNLIGQDGHKLTQLQQQHQLQQQQQQTHQQQSVPVIPLPTHQSHQEQQQQQRNQVINSVSLAAMAAATATIANANVNAITNAAALSTSNIPSADDDDDDESGDDSTTQLTQLAQLKQEQQPQQQQQQQSMDIGADEDHNYVAHEEDDSFGDGNGRNLSLSGATMNEQDHMSTSQSSLMEGPNGSKRVRRSEASLAQAAKLVSKGQTFQTVSNIFNIPVSTIRFYMARKGILPKRKRGRGASSNLGIGVNITGTAMVSETVSAVTAAAAAAASALTASTIATATVTAPASTISASNVATVMTQALVAQMKGNAILSSDNAITTTEPTTTSTTATTLSHINATENPYNNINYKLEPGTAHMI